MLSALTSTSMPLLKQHAPCPKTRAFWFFFFSCFFFWFVFFGGQGGSLPVNCFRGNVAVDSANCQMREGARLLWSSHPNIHLTSGCFSSALTELLLVNVQILIVVIYKCSWKCIF